MADEMLGRADSGEGADHREFEIFVSGTRELWHERVVPSAEIMQRAGFQDPAKFELEALDRERGNVVAEFRAEESVDLAQPDRRFFRVTPGGGGRS